MIEGFEIFNTDKADLRKNQIEPLEIKKINIVITFKTVWVKPREKIN